MDIFKDNKGNIYIPGQKKSVLKFDLEIGKWIFTVNEGNNNGELLMASPEDLLQFLNREIKRD